MHDAKKYGNLALRAEFKADLTQLAEGVKSCVTAITSTGLDKESIASLLEVAGDLSVTLPRLDPLTQGQAFGMRYQDKSANALLRGANPEDGGGVGVALIATADGSCFFNAIATAAWGARRRIPTKTDQLALPLRVAVILAGVKRLGDIRDESSSYFRRRDAYDAEVVRVAQAQTPLNLAGIFENDIYEEDVSRALLTLALSTMTGEYSYVSSFCLPLVAEVLGANVRFYIPVASLTAEDGSPSVIGGAHNRTLHSPPPRGGRAPPSVTIHIAASIYNRGEHPGFANLEEFRIWRMATHTDEHGVAYSKSLNHFVPICPGAPIIELQSLADEEDPGEVKEGDGGLPGTNGQGCDARAGRGKSGRRLPAWENALDTDDELDPIAQSWRNLSRDKSYLEGIQEEKKKMPLGDDYNPRSTMLLSGAYDLGLPEDKIPSGLRMTDAKKVDIDYARYRLRTVDLGKGVLDHHDTLSYQRPSLRGMNIPSNMEPLYLTRGPGVTYVLVEVDENEVRCGRTTAKEEVKKARDDIIKEICRHAPSMALQPSSSHNLICRSHQTVTGGLLRKVLTALAYDDVWHVQWGLKCDVSELQTLDEAAKKAPPVGDAIDAALLSNVFDVATTYKGGGVPLVSSWAVGRSDHGDRLAQPGATPMRCYPQAPGLFYRPFGSTQTRYGTPWPGIEKVTMYSKWEHLLRCEGLFQWVHPKVVGRGQRNLEYLRRMSDKLATPEGMAHVVEHGLGLRVEVRALAATAEEAVRNVEDLGILDPIVAWKGLGQFQVEFSEDGQESITHFPVWVIPPEIYLANSMRVTQAARKIVMGSSTKEVTEEMGVANTDAFAAAGHTDKGRRASTGFTCGASFWVHDVEKAHDAPATSIVRRKNPVRAARKSPIVDLSASEIFTGEISTGGGVDGEGVDSASGPTGIASDPENRESGDGVRDGLPVDGPEMFPEGGAASGTEVSGPGESGHTLDLEWRLGHETRRRDSSRVPGTERNPIALVSLVDLVGASEGGQAHNTSARAGLAGAGFDEDESDQKRGGRWDAKGKCNRLVDGGTIEDGGYGSGLGEFSDGGVEVEAFGEWGGGWDGDEISDDNANGVACEDGDDESGECGVGEGGVGGGSFGELGGGSDGDIFSDEGPDGVSCDDGDEASDRGGHSGGVLSGAVLNPRLAALCDGDAESEAFYPEEQNEVEGGHLEVNSLSGCSMGMGLEEMDYEESGDSDNEGYVGLHAEDVDDEEGVNLFEQGGDSEGETDGSLREGAPVVEGLDCYDVARGEDDSARCRCLVRRPVVGQVNGPEGSPSPAGTTQESPMSERSARTLRMRAGRWLSGRSATISEMPKSRSSIRAASEVRSGVNVGGSSRERPVTSIVVRNDAYGAREADESSGRKNQGGLSSGGRGRGGGESAFGLRAAVGEADRSEEDLAGTTQESTLSDGSAQIPLPYDVGECETNSEMWTAGGISRAVGDVLVGVDPVGDSRERRAASSAGGRDGDVPHGENSSSERRNQGGQSVHGQGRGGGESAFGLRAAARRCAEANRSAEGDRTEGGGEGTVGRKRPAVDLSRGFASHAGRRPQAQGRALPRSEEVNMRRRVRIRKHPFKSGCITWVKKSSNPHSRRTGSGSACADVDAVYAKLWELYSYGWVDQVQ